MSNFYKTYLWKSAVRVIYVSCDAKKLHIYYYYDYCEKN